MKTNTNRNKLFTIANLSVVGYFIVIYLLHSFKVNHVLIGVFYEMFTIPSILASGVLSIIAIISFIRNQKQTPLRLLSGVLIITTAIIVYYNLFN